MKSAYDCLANYHLSSHDDVFKQLWQAKGIPKVLTTAWRILLDRIPTHISLIRRVVMVISSPSCALCQEKDKTMQHLFLECTIAQRAWSLCFKWVGIVFIQHKDVPCHFESFHLEELSSKQNLIWKGMWGVVVFANTFDTNDGFKCRSIGH